MKKFLRTAFVIMAGYGVYVNHKNDSMSDLANIKALARYELPEVEIVM